MEEILKFRQYIFTLLLLSPRGKRRGPSFEKIWIPFTQGCFVPSLVEIGPVVLEKKKKMGKVYDNADGQRTNCDQKSSLEPLTQVSLKHTHIIRVEIHSIKKELMTSHEGQASLNIF